MKKLVFLFALLIQSILVSASVEPATVARANTDNVKMYSQAGTSAEVIKALKSTDVVTVVRKHNANWSIVTINGQVGYVLTSELSALKENKDIALAQPARRK